MEKPKKRVVSYVRVSSSSKAQLHSYEFQEEYWRGRFENDPDMELICIYADRGISGSSVYKRPQFLTMMQDAREGKFDVIYTKSVSRFARNTVQLLEAVRELRELGIEVVFEKEQISTFQPTSELFLTIAATVAENDLRVDSERQEWSVRHRFENGWICIGGGMYGYTMTEDNNLVIVEEEAKVVRRIFDMYLKGVGLSTIAKTLNAEGLRNSVSHAWRPFSVSLILDNEKYKGDAMMGKSTTINGIRYDNMDGKYGKRYYMEDTHEGIVSKEVFNQAQQLRQARRNYKLYRQKRPEYLFTGLVECGECGKHYQHKVNNSGKKWQTDVWVCATQLKTSVADCSCNRIKDSVLRAKFVEAYNEFVTTRPQGADIDMLQQAISSLWQEERELAGLYVQRLIPEAAFRTEQHRIKMRIEEYAAKIAELRGKTVRESDFNIITDFEPEKVEKFITKVIVRKGTVTFVFYNGVAITKPFTNGPAGNQKGWMRKKEAAACQ